MIVVIVVKPVAIGSITCIVPRFVPDGVASVTVRVIEPLNIVGSVTKSVALGTNSSTVPWFVPEGVARVIV